MSAGHFTDVKASGFMDNRPLAMDRRSKLPAHSQNIFIILPRMAAGYPQIHCPCGCAGVIHLFMYKKRDPKPPNGLKIKVDMEYMKS